MKKGSIIDALHQVEAVKHNEDCIPHLIIGMDACEHGQPHAGLLLTQGSPAVLLGMIETLMHDLAKTKKSIMKEMTLYKIKDRSGETLADKEEKKKRLSTPEEMQQKIEATKNEVEKIIKRLPPEIADKIKKFQDKMNEAIERKDTAELQKMRDAMQNASSVADLENIIKNISNDDDFDLSAFKGD